MLRDAYSKLTQAAAQFLSYDHLGTPDQLNQALAEAFAAKAKEYNK